MNDWTDEQLGALITDALRAHEHLADADTARRLATAAAPSRRRRATAVIGAAAAVVLIGSGTAYALGHGRDATTPPGPASPGVSNGPVSPAAPTTTVAANRRLAAAESARIIGLVPLPAGATRLAGEPAGWPSDWGESLGPSDGSLTRTSWWSVPLPVQDVTSHLATHAPAGMRHAPGDDPMTEVSPGFWTATYEEASRAPASYTDPQLLVQVHEMGGRTLVRADSFLGARAVRTPEEEIPGLVTGVTIERVAAQGPGRTGGPLPTVQLTYPVDRDAIDRLVRAINGLYASIDPPAVLSCPAMLPPLQKDTLTFHTGRGTFVFRLTPWCNGQVEVSHDGHALAPTLDPGDLVNVIDREAADH